MIGRSVVVGVDGSAEARDAVALARRLTEASGGRLHLVAAGPEFSVEVAAIRARLPLDRVREALRASAAESAANGLADLLDRQEIERVLTVRLGRAEHVLAEAGLEMEADLFVLGGRRHLPPMSWLNRGTAHHLLRVGARPVVVTGPNEGRIERVLAAVDLSFAATPTVRVAGSLAALLDVPLEAVHVSTRPELPRGLGFDFDFDRAPEQLEREAERELRAVMPEASVPLTVRSGEVVPSLRRAAKEEPPALLVLGAQGRGWVHRLLLGSTTEALLAELPCSLAVVPSSPEPASRRATD